MRNSPGAVAAALLAGAALSFTTSPVQAANLNGCNAWFPISEATEILCDPEVWPFFGGRLFVVPEGQGTRVSVRFFDWPGTCVEGDVQGCRGYVTGRSGAQTDFSAYANEPYTSYYWPDQVTQALATCGCFPGGPQ
jgi:hypothetical protein